ncbi:hypothetical protein [Streptomyces sp. NPDC059371]|uniref:hypothetical protein n=1 Tax=Streptomyces sp. NPDC059371 TaxID=3346812 RepID=UPI0036C530FD
MSDQDWYDDSAYENAAEQSHRVARAGWTAILGVSGLLGAAAIAAAVVCVASAAGMIYVVMTATR